MGGLALDGLNPRRRLNVLFRALDDPTRRRLLDLLGERDHTAGELAAAFALGKPTVSHHLALLRQAGLVSAHKEGQSIRYRLEATVLDECLSWFLNLIERGKQQSTCTPPIQTHETIRFLRREFLQIVLLILPFALAAAWWNRIPPVVVTHWNVHGQPNGWMHKVPGLLLRPTLNVAVCLLLAFLPRIAPRLRADPAADGTRYRRVLRIYRYAITTLIAEIAAAVIALAAGWRVDIGLIAVNGMLALFAVMGNYLGTLPPTASGGRVLPMWRDDGTRRATNRWLGTAAGLRSTSAAGRGVFREPRDRALSVDRFRDGPGLVGIGILGVDFPAAAAGVSGGRR